MGVIQTIAALDIVIWLYLLLAHGKFWLPLSFDTIDVPLPACWPDVCVVIPARNEADILGATLPTLLTNDYPALRIVLVDDHSEDDTAAVAAQLAAQHDASDRLTVINGKKLLSWKGKVAAMQNGFECVATFVNTPRYVLFTDADIAYEQGMIKRLVAHAEAGNYVQTSLMVLLRCQSFAERWLVPAFVYFFQMLYPFRQVNNPSNKMAAAAGGCMLTRYDVLMSVGGLSPIRSALIDDCALGAVMKRQGPIWLGLTQKVHSVRPYPHIKDIASMVSRTAFDQLGYSNFKLVGTLLGLLLTFIAPVLLTLTGSGLAWTLGVLSWVCMSLMCMPMLRFYKRPLVMSLILPVIALLYIVFTFDSAYQYWRGRGGQWKGRVQAGLQSQ
jgi:hopene-associated glycosyltransferase HpnB